MKRAINVAVVAFIVYLVLWGYAWKNSSEGFEADKRVWANRASSLEEVINQKNAEIESLQLKIMKMSRDEGEFKTKYVGEFLCTSYCGKCDKCQTTGVTYSGTPVTYGLTCAVSKSNLSRFPLGTVLYVEGQGFVVVQDIGGGVSDDQLDIAISPSHSENLKWDGYGKHNVWVVQWEE